jgi:hypothetical protein
MKAFRRELEELINKHSMENGSNTPDFMLAEYLMDCLRAFDKVMKRRDLWYRKLEWENQPQDYKNFVKKCNDKGKEISEKIAIKTADEIDYNNLCARATLYPGKSIEEVKDIQYVNRVNESYKFINSVLLGTKPMNNRQTREWVQKTLEGRLNKYGVVAKCNEESNTSEVIDKNLLLATIMRPNSDNSPGFRYMNLVFGDEQRVRDYQIEHYFDNSIYTFIEKGI